eukprot:SAG31_NODE_1325_length_8781_cov_5.940221_9_plen_118_part_00
MECEKARGGAPAAGGKLGGGGGGGGGGAGGGGGGGGGLRAAAVARQSGPSVPAGLPARGGGRFAGPAVGSSADTRDSYMYVNLGVMLACRQLCIGQIDRRRPHAVNVDTVSLLWIYR